MRIVDLYYVFGGKKGSFLQQKWSAYCMNREKKQKQKYFKKYGMEMLLLFFEICRNHGINCWLEYGTLLGAYRNASFIPYDIDLDVGIPANEFSEELEQKLFENGFKRVRDFVLVDVANNTKMLTELCYAYKGGTIDVFLSFEEGDVRNSYVYINEYADDAQTRRKVKMFLLDKAFPMSKLTINGVSFTGPSNPAKVLAKIYGENFMTPLPNWKPNRNNPYVKYLDANSFYGIYSEYK